MKVTKTNGDKQTNIHQLCYNYERRQENHKIGVKEAIFHSLDAMAVRKTLQDREPSVRRERAKVGELCECLEEEKLRLQRRHREFRREGRGGQEGQV